MSRAEDESSFYPFNIIIFSCSRHFFVFWKKQNIVKYILCWLRFKANHLQSPPITSQSPRKLSTNHLPITSRRKHKSSHICCLLSCCLHMSISMIILIVSCVVCVCDDALLLMNNICVVVGFFCSACVFLSSLYCCFLLTHLFTVAFSLAVLSYVVAIVGGSCLLS